LYPVQFSIKCISSLQLVYKISMPLKLMS